MRTKEIKKVYKLMHELMDNIPNQHKYLDRFEEANEIMEKYLKHNFRFNYLDIDNYHEETLKNAIWCQQEEIEDMKEAYVENKVRKGDVKECSQKTK